MSSSSASNALTTVDMVEKRFDISCSLSEMGTNQLESVKSFVASAAAGAEEEEEYEHGRNALFDNDMVDISSTTTDDGATSATTAFCTGCSCFAGSSSLKSATG